MDIFRRLFPWLTAAAGVAAILKLDMLFQEPGAAVIAVFVLTGILSSLRPGLAALWAAIAGGGLSGAEAAGVWADPQSMTVSPGIMAMLLLLPVAIGIAGAAAGAAMTEDQTPNARDR